MLKSGHVENLAQYEGRWLMTNFALHLKNETSGPTKLYLFTTYACYDQVKNLGYITTQAPCTPHLN